MKFDLTRSKVLEQYLKLSNLRTVLNNKADKTLGIILSTLSFIGHNSIVYAAQGDRIITVIKTITQDIYADFVYLSLGFLTTVCIYHLIFVVFNSGEEQARNKHVKAIITAVVAWIVINIFAFFIGKIFSLTGQSTPADIFNAGGYN